MVLITMNPETHQCEIMGYETKRFTKRLRCDYLINGVLIFNKFEYDADNTYTFVVEKDYSNYKEYRFLAHLVSVTYAHKTDRMQKGGVVKLDETIAPYMQSIIDTWVVNTNFRKPHVIDSGRISRDKRAGRIAQENNIKS